MRKSTPIGLVLVACALWSAPVAAYELKHTPSGQPVRWTTPGVAFVVDPSVAQAAPGGVLAVEAAVQAWTAVSGAPALTAAVGPAGGQPADEGQNTILYAPRGYAPAGSALAVTISSIDDATGTLLDTDIVINGAYAFAVLPSGARPAKAAPMATDGSGGASAGAGDAGHEPQGDGEGDGSGRSASQDFDLQHVVAHEVGHALGLGDVHGDASALMYALSTPGSADSRAPAADDSSGLEVLYAGSAASAGCGQSNLAGARPGQGEAWLGLGLLGVVIAWSASTRRGRLGAPVFAGALLLGTCPDAARPLDPSAAGIARAVVVGVEVSEVEGVLRSALDLAPTRCARSCPARARAVMWGGTRAGRTQRVGGRDVPRAGDSIDVVLVDTKAEPSALVLAERR